LAWHKLLGQRSGLIRQRLQTNQSRAQPDKPLFHWFGREMQSNHKADKQHGSWSNQG
jgi:hypothetical protein